MTVLQGLLYTREHEWLRVEGDKAYLGITDFAQQALGDIVFVELPEVGTEFSAEEPFGVVESVKAASDIFIPVDGTIIEVNEALIDNPALVNEGPYENWMICFALTDKGQLDALMGAEAYEALCKEEA